MQVSPGTHPLKGYCQMVLPPPLEFSLHSRMETHVQILAARPAQLDHRMETRAQPPLDHRTQSPTLHIRSFLPTMTPKVPWFSLLEVQFPQFDCSTPLPLISHMLFLHFQILSTWAHPYPQYQVLPLVVDETLLIEPPTLHFLHHLIISLKPRVVGVVDSQAMGQLEALPLLDLLVWLVPQALLHLLHLSMVST